MTVGMLIESLASKIGVHYADFVDSSPFQWSDERRAIDVFGEQLLKTGQFNRYGSEVMYSAITGDPMPADIFIGVVYYQRLRHMVSDKYQVRAEGPSDKITKQPIKGRKRVAACASEKWSEMLCWPTELWRALGVDSAQRVTPRSTLSALHVEVCLECSWAEVSAENVRLQATGGSYKYPWCCSFLPMTSQRWV